MKIEDVKKMTDEELKVKIAKICRWKKKFIGYAPDDGSLGISESRYSIIPNYPKNLNVMNETELEVFNRRPASAEIFLKYLQEIVGVTFPIHATARQRAEAFVLAMERK